MSNTEQSLKIFGIIAQIEQLVETAPRPKLGGNVKRIVDVEEIFDLLGDLKVVIPEDIRRANSVLIEADTIFENANENATEMLETAKKESEDIRQQADAYAEDMRVKAEREFEARVAEHEVYTEAVRRAEQLQAMAEENANIVFTGAKQYADEILFDLQRYLSEYQNMVEQNRAELGVVADNTMQHMQQQQQSQQQPQQAPAAQPQQRKQRQHRWVAEQPAESFEDEDDAFEEQPHKPARKKGWFARRKAELNEDFLDEDEEFEEAEEVDEWEEEVDVRPRGRRRNREAEMDLDLDMD